ncbi:T9SS type A sorting domain-containing protein, partial [bacterium]|nr:T9SS type A sorting domain-containing protein [bacterium]
LDLSEPPPVGSFVSLYFPHLDWDRYPDRLTVDFRPPVEKVQIWEFVVESNIPNSTVRLSWDNIENLPIGLNASLIDKEENIALDLRARQSYSFASGGGKEFLLVVGSDTNERHSRASLPKEYTLYQNFPNPFNPVTTISFDVPEKTKIKLSLFNVLGKEVKVLADGIYCAGHHEIDIDARNLCAGVYFYRIKANGFADVKKMVLLK